MTAEVRAALLASSTVASTPRVPPFQSLGVVLLWFDGSRGNLCRTVGTSVEFATSTAGIVERCWAWRDKTADDSVLATTTQTPVYAEERDELEQSVIRAAISLLRNHGHRLSFLAPALISPESILTVAAVAVVDPPGRRLRCCRRPLRAKIIWLLGHVAPHRLM